MNKFLRRWLVLTAVSILIFGVLAGCGGKTPAPPSSPDPGGDNGSPDPGGNNGSQGEEVDLGAFYLRDWKGSETLKFEWWQKVDGEESSGWITVDVSQGDGEYTVEYHGVLGDSEYTNADTFTLEYGGITFQLGIIVKEMVDHYLYSRLWNEATVPVLENFEGFDLYRVGDKGSVFGYEVEVVGHNTYAGQKGLTMTMKQNNKQVYEVCLSPDIAVNLYSYTYDYYGNEYEVTLVEYSD